MKTMLWLVAVVLTAGLSLITACSDAGSVGDAGIDGSTDTDTDASADTDSDIGIDPDECEDLDCTMFVNGSLEDYTDHDGSSWELAYAEVQEGLRTAAILIESGEDQCAVWVAAGTYLPTRDPNGDNDPDDPRTKTFLLKTDVLLYGGFDGNEISCSERDIDANETILSGDLGIPDDNADNSYHVVTGADLALIDGFTVTGGNADFQWEYSNAGGGMLNVACSPIVKNCTFADNSAVLQVSLESTTGVGGGMFNNNSALTIANCTFEDNVAGELGGGMYNEGGAPTVSNCTFSNNLSNWNGSADWNASGWYGSGGGIFSTGSSPTVTNCTFSGNSAMFGGAMYNDFSLPTVTNCMFEGNVAGESGGGMYNSGCSWTVTGCTFSANQAATGGGMFNTGISLAVMNCILWGNTASVGSEMDNFDGTVSVSHSVVQGGCDAIIYTDCIDGNIDADPLFVDAESGDLRLQPGSPCIDTGNNEAVPDDVATDLDGNPRVVDGDDDSTAIVDMGAYEYQP